MNHLYYGDNLAALNRATIAFDLDGTLVESAPDLIGTLNAILIAEGFEPLPYDQGRPFIGGGARWLLQRGLAAAGAQNPAARADALLEHGLSNCAALYLFARRCGGRRNSGIWSLFAEHFQ
jgi:phosphoglycolate phosphatase